MIEEKYEIIFNKNNGQREEVRKIEVDMYFYDPDLKKMICRDDYAGG